MVSGTLGFLSGVPLAARSTTSIRQRSTCPRMAVGTYVGEGMKTDDVLVLGVATCFLQEKGKLKEVTIVEPLPASALDCVARLQVTTSYKRLYGISLGDLPDTVSELPASLLGEDQVALAEDFGERAQAAARTYRRSPEIASTLPPGAMTSEVNHSVATKRILNENYEPSFDDNVKQDMTIDVYNRATDEVDNTAVAAGYNA